MSLKSVVLPRMRRQRGWDCLLYCFVFRDGSSTRLVSLTTGYKDIICDIKPALKLNWAHFQTNENDMRKMEPAIIMNQARNESIRKKIVIISDILSTMWSSTILELPRCHWNRWYFLGCVGKGVGIVFCIVSSFVMDPVLDLFHRQAAEKDGEKMGFPRPRTVELPRWGATGGRLRPRPAARPANPAWPDGHRGGRNVRQEAEKKEGATGRSARKSGVTWRPWPISFFFRSFISFHSF